MLGNLLLRRYAKLFLKPADATAVLKGSPRYPQITGKTYFYGTPDGVAVLTAVEGLPKGGRCAGRIFGFHIHEGGACSGTVGDPFADTGSHYNPHGCAHPFHAGDLPPLFGCDGRAVSAFLTDRFTVREILGKTLVIHDSPDDFHTAPSGNSGAKIACGRIVKGDA